MVRLALFGCCRRPVFADRARPCKPPAGVGAGPLLAVSGCARL